MHKRKKKKTTSRYEKGILYRLAPTLSKLNRMGDKSAKNIISSIEKSKATTLSRFISGLGIRHIGQNTAKILEKYFKDDIKKLMSASNDELLNINEIGEIMAESITIYFSIITNQNLIIRCIDRGITFTVQDIIQSDIANKVFVFTGNLKSFTRSKAIEIIEMYGAKKSSSVSRKTDYLIAGSNSGSIFKKAQELNVKILNEKLFIQLIELLKK